ncbi:MAG: pyridoxamine 5'-phosphate oxidase family protein [Acidimicrobiales bacterium]
MRDRRDDPVLTPSECLQLLAQAEVGRIAVSMDALPVIIPVAFAVIDDQVHFRSIRDSKMDAAVDHRVVAFESGAYAPEEGTGWSVLVQGMTQAVDESDSLWSPASPFPPTTPSASSEERYRMIRIQPASVTGRRMRIMSSTGTTIGATDVPFLYLSSGD